MLRAADHDDARTMLLWGQVFRLARMRCGPTVAGQCRFLTGFPWLPSELIGRHPCRLSQCPKLTAGRLATLVDTPVAVGESYLCQHN